MEASSTSDFLSLDVKSEENTSDVIHVISENEVEEMDKTWEKSGEQSEEENGESFSNSRYSKKSKIYYLTPRLREKLKRIPGALEYIKQLERTIERQRENLSKWRNKLRKRKTKVKSTQTILSGLYTLPVVTNDVKEVKQASETPKTIAEEIKEAAEEIVQNSGFVYEETSGLYYDYNSGYYYNAEYGLYYDGNTGTYLKYNQETHSYDFHSQVAKPKEETGATLKSKLKVKRKMQKTPKKKAST